MARAGKEKEMFEVHSNRPLRFATFLSPNLSNSYEYVARYIGKMLDRDSSLSVGQSIDEFADGEADAGFLCGLIYARMASYADCPVELLAAPVLLGMRYAGQPIYFSDVIERKESRYSSFDDLDGCVWAYNEFTSHSGWNLVCYSLLQQGRTPGYFGTLVKSGSHLRSVRMVLDGYADAASIDSHVLDVLLQQDAGLRGRLRVIKTFGPSAIPPVVVAKRLDERLKYRLRTALLQMHNHPTIAQELRKGLIERFVHVTNDQYGGILDMLAQVELAQTSDPLAGLVLASRR